MNEIHTLLFILLGELCAGVALISDIVLIYFVASYFVFGKGKKK